MPSNFKKFNKIALALAFILLAFSCLLFWFLYSQTNNNNKIYQTAGEEWQNEANRRDEMKFIEKSVKMIDQERSQLETHFSKSTDVVMFLDTIEKLALRVGAKAQVKLVNVSEDHISLVVDIQALGSFEAVYKFLMLLENSQYELEIVSMDIKKLNVEILPSDNPTSKEWSATFKIKLLSFIP